MKLYLPYHQYFFSTSIICEIKSCFCFFKRMNSSKHNIKRWIQPQICQRFSSSTSRLNSLGLFSHPQYILLKSEADSQHLADGSTSTMEVCLNRRNGFGSPSQSRPSKSWSVSYNTEPGPSLGFIGERSEMKLRIHFQSSPTLSMTGSRRARQHHLWEWFLMARKASERPQSQTKVVALSATGRGVSRVKTPEQGLLDACRPSGLFTLFSLSTQLASTQSTVVQGLSGAPLRVWMAEVSPRGCPKAVMNVF